MSNRIETVTLKLDDQFSSGMARAAAQTAALRTEVQGLNRSGAGGGVRTTDRDLDHLGSTSRRASTDLGRLNTSARSSNAGLSALRRETRSAGNELDSFSGRLGVMATSVAALGPALVPAAAGLAPAVAGLSAGFLAAATSAGVAGLAFHGVGDALKALDAYQLEPTAANLQKLHETLGRLPASAQSFVHTLDEMEPVLAQLRTAAADGLFPGAEAGIHSLLSLLPEVKQTVSSVAKELGTLSADAGHALANDPEFLSFFNYLRTDAAPTLDAFARSAGNMIAGLTQIFVDFAPLSRDFSGGLLDMSRSFRQWADGLSRTQGFRQFVDYLRESGPQIKGFLSATADAAVELVKAMAPWGSTVLPILTDVAKALGAVAGSPIGPVIYEAAAAMLVFNKAVSPIGDRLGNIRTSFTGLTGDLRTMRTEMVAIGPATENLAAAQGRMTERAAGLKSALGSLAGAGGVLALTDGLGHAASGARTLEDALGGAAVGFSVGGPWGAAIGSAAGLAAGLWRQIDHDSDSLDHSRAIASQAARGWESLTASLDKNTGAFTRNSAAAVANQLSSNKAGRALIDKASKYGISVQELGAALTGNAPALARVNALMGTLGDSTQRLQLKNAALYDQLGKIDVSDENKVAINKRKIDQINDQIKANDRLIQKNRDLQQTWTAEGGALAKNQKAVINNIATLHAYQLETRGIPKSIATKVSAPGAVKTAADVTNLHTKYHLTPREVQTVMKVLGVPGVSKQVQGLLARFNTLPKDIQSDIMLHGVPKSEADIERLQAKYRHTPADVRTLALLKDNASGPIASVLAKLRSLDGKTAHTSVTNTTTNITIERRIIENQAAKNRAEIGHARGAFRENGHIAFADGGYGTDGRYYSRQPMLVPGGANILWGEKETGWEAYISGKPGERDRNLQILSLAADRLGATVTAYASGGTAGQVIAGTARHSTSLAPLIEALPLRQLALLGDIADDLSRTRLGRLGKALDAASKAEKKATDAALSRYDSLKEQRKAYTDSITTGLRGDLWGGSSSGGAFGSASAAGSPAAVTAQLRQQTAQAKQFSKDIATLKKKGISGAALAEIISSGDYQRAHMFALATTAQDKAYAQAYNARQSATAAAAKTGGIDLTPGLNAALAAYHHDAKELAGIKKELGEVRKLLSKAETAAQAEDSRKRHGAGPAAAKGRRHQR